MSNTNECAHQTQHAAQTKQVAQTGQDTQASETVQKEQTPQTLAFELGVEEIPAFDLHKASEQLQQLVPERLSAHAVPFERVTVFSTPRRLGFIVKQVAAQTQAQELDFRGPSAKIALDENGNFTKAALGFARSKNVSASALELRDCAGERYVFAHVSSPSQSTTPAIQAALLEIITSIAWPKSCRWASRSETFSRPVRWIVCLFGSKVVPLTFAGLHADRFTWGHRVLSAGKHEISSADALLDTLRHLQIVPFEDQRKERILDEVAHFEKKLGLHAEIPAKTLLEVTNLCEAPHVLVCSFDESFLAVPKEIIVDAMLMHQRYFPFYTNDGALTNYFAVVSNAAERAFEQVKVGNERVVRARLDDAKFFYEEDLKHPLEWYVDKLKQVVFQQDLGTMYDKTMRIEACAKQICASLDATEQEKQNLCRAALLCKADLVTNAVIEFTSVQGIMGGYYARACGENDQVAQAITQHYQPRFAGDALPCDLVACGVALIDKLDTICGLFAIDQAPTGSSDPFALRRSAIGALSILDAYPQLSLSATLTALLDLHAQAGVSFDKQACYQAVYRFILGRLRVMLKDEGIAPQTIDAIVAVQPEHPRDIMLRCRALEKVAREQRDDYENLTAAYVRAWNLHDISAGMSVDDALCNDAERALLAKVQSVKQQLEHDLEHQRYEEACSVLASLRVPIDALFASTLIMDADEALKKNHLAVLNCFVDVFSCIADFSCLAKG